MRRRLRTDDQEPGSDSFLDVVANLVGILIILVMVVGVRAKDAFLEVAPREAADVINERERQKLAATRRATEQIQQDVQRLTEIMQQQDLEIAYRREERDRIDLMIQAANEAIEKHRGELTAVQQQQFDAQRQLIAARRELAQIQQQQAALEATGRQTEIIHHLPTPMAKTVFGKEFHLLLTGHRVTYVPWEELVAELKKEAPQKVWRLNEQTEFTETLGPIGGFWMKYTIKRSAAMLPVRGGMAVSQRVELDHFELLPVDANRGEAIDAAFQPGSLLLSRLAENPPQETTITIWVYPDSFGDFRKLKQRFYEMGYLTAARPMPEGYPIGGSPQGTRSAGQ